MKIITSWDDGRKDDLRLKDLLLKYEIPAIFFIPNNGELSVDEIEELSKNFAIGGHTVSHPILRDIGEDQAYHEIICNKVWLEAVINKKIEWFSYPKGKYNDKVKKLVKKAGFKYARTVDVLSTEKPKDNYAVKTAIHISYPDRKEYKGEDVFKLARELFDKAKKENGIYHLWGHSWEIDKYKMWDKVEELFKYINKYINENLHSRV